jgi:hypothetical protein
MFSTNKTISSKLFILKINKINFIFFKNAMTLGITFFNLPAFFVGILVDQFGCRFIKLISM